MNSYHDELKRFEYANTSSAAYSYVNVVKKPLELYVFVDPLCAECWSLEPYLKKLSIEYGRFFTIRPIVSGHVFAMNLEPFDKPCKLKDMWERTALRTGMSCDTNVWKDHSFISPRRASLAIKAAELQGKKAGRLFLRKIQENAFLKKQNISEESVLLNCAEEAKLDIEEFKCDLYSDTAKKALQSDFKLTNEMNVDYIPTMVFFNPTSEQPGIKISGLYPYEIYVRVLKQMLDKRLIPSTTPPLELLLSHYKVVATKEIAVVYDWSTTKAERELKKLQIRQKVKKHVTNHGSFWEYRSRD
ncbi:ClpXP adapter SpxH family protein [Lentibacillus saliphilus]|uniref:ClpXP adapter SpxH family protein n=1 Tax=Lentibacillus saliphilus TaxID=2737028 RepID=UPI001C2F1A65